MRVDVSWEADAEDARREVADLEARHESFEALRQRVFVERCTEPQGVDDYVAWKALREDGALEDRTVFETAEVFGALTPRRVELLEHLRGNDVGTIKELAAALRRDYKNTYDDLVALRAWGLVSLRKEGKNRRPLARVTTLRVSWQK